MRATTQTSRQIFYLACVPASRYGRDMSCVIALVNTKGGVGKSFLATSMAVWLHDQGYNVALVDADDQQTSSKWLSGIKEHSIKIKTLDEKSEEKRADELRKLINDYRDKFDFIMVDTKGAAGLSTSAGVIKSDIACIPLQASAADLWPIENALSVIRLSQEARGGIPKAFLVLNQTDDVDVRAREVRELAKQFDVPMARTNIKRLRAYRDAPGSRSSPTRPKGKRGQKAANRLEELFTELLDGFLVANKQRVANE